MKNLIKTAINKGKTAEILGSMLLLCLFVLPAFGLAGSDKIYVDDSASGKQDGSSKHPYKTINEAMSHSDGDTEMHVANGTYEENIHLRDGRELYGESRDGVIIKADDDDYEAVDLDDDTVINKVTISGGKYGVRVGHNEKASIIDCVIKDNDSTGIILEESDTDDKYKVSISDSVIKDNDRAGVFSAKRRLAMTDNEVHNNGGDGIIIGAGSRVWLENNSFNDNDGSGMKLYLDGAYIWTEDNNFKRNDREGIEINAYGSVGTLDLKDNTITDNHRWGIARVQRKSLSAGIWNGVAIHSDNNIWENKHGNISGIFYIY